MWFCATSLGSICIGILIAGYILAFVKKTQPDWFKVIGLSLVVLLPCIALIWLGIRHNDWNFPVAVISFVMTAAATSIGIKAEIEAMEDPEKKAKENSENA